MKKIDNVHTIFQVLLQQIQQENQVKTISERFSIINTNFERVNFVYELLQKYELWPDLIDDKKCDESATLLREKGNAEFKNKRLKEAVEIYTESLAFAPEGSQNVSKALANRSAALFELELYHECLIDINRAFENNYPEDLKPKLLRRKEKALQLKSTMEQNIYFNPIPNIPKSSQSDSIQCASKSIEIKHSEVQGRHIVATSNIKIGEILAVEKPFCQILASEYLSHCYDCLKIGYNLIPCSHCTQVFYCDESCSRHALKYHKYECNILKTLRNLQLDKLKLLPLRIVLVVKDLYSTIASYCDQVNKDDNYYKSEQYEEIHNLVGNTNSRSVADLFERSVVAAVIFSLIKKHTDFFSCEEDETTFKDILLLHLQTAPCNFHEISELAEVEEGYYEAREIGAGAFSFLSLFNHSCNPNVVRHCHGNTVVVRAIRSINIGEQCYDNYGYHFAVMPRSDRINTLKKQYFFDCHCDVCENNWPLLEHLPYMDHDSGVSSEDISRLRKGDRRVAKEVCQKLLPKMHELEQVQPNRLFFEMQEVLKRCYALFGNFKRF